MKRILIIAGPNGAGKTTFAKEFLPNEAACPEFVNADLIAAGLSPFQPDKLAITAGRMMLERINQLVDAGRSFSFETTLSTRSFLRSIPSWQKQGYRVELHCLKLPDAAFAANRVSRRVHSRSFAVGIPSLDRLGYTFSCRIFAGDPAHCLFLPCPCA